MWRSERIRFREGVAATAALAFLAACAGLPGGQSATPGFHQTAGAARRPNSGTSASKFKHVIVVMEENRTVDNLFNGFPGADTVTMGDRDGQEVALQPVPLQPGPGSSAGLDHGHKGFVEDYDGGLMDGFDHEFSSSNPGTAYAYVEPSQVQNYWQLATRFTLSDEVFQANMGPSFPSHIAMVAGQTGYPFAVAELPGTRFGVGCFGDEKVAYIDMRTAFPGVEDKGPACVEVSTVFDLLDAKSIAWRYYAPNYGIGRSYWSGTDYIRHLALGPDHAKLISPETQILSDVANRNLPAVSYVAPEACTSDHPWSSGLYPEGGPLWVAELTNTIGASSYWKDTLILVTWDDWGGWYDHVAPAILNANQVGFRTPLLVISAYPANPGKPDHTIRNQASMITAIESIFKLSSLGQLDSQTDDLSSDFNFSAAPVPYGSPLPAATPPPQKLCDLS